MPTFRVRQGSHVQHVQDSTAKLAARQIGVRGNGTIAVTDLQTETTQYYKFRAPRLSGGSTTELSTRVAKLDGGSNDVAGLAKRVAKLEFSKLVDNNTIKDIKDGKHNEAFEFIWVHPKPWNHDTEFNYENYKAWKTEHPTQQELKSVDILKKGSMNSGLTDETQEALWKHSEVTSLSDWTDWYEEAVNEKVVEHVRNDQDIDITVENVKTFKDAVQKYINEHRPENLWNM